MKFLSLSQGELAIIDDEDFEKVGHFKWYALKSGRAFYAARNVGRKPNQTLVLLHCDILGIKGVDHRDGNGLNCCRENLRPATKQQNAQAFCRKKPGTSSKFRGVTWHKGAQKWRAKIMTNGKFFHLGLFDHEDAAAWAYDAVAKANGFFKEASNFPSL